MDKPDNQMEALRKELSKKLIPILEKYPSHVVIPCLVVELIVAFVDEDQLDGELETLLGIVANSWDTVCAAQKAVSEENGGLN